MYWRNSLYKIVLLFNIELYKYCCADTIYLNLNPHFALSNCCSIFSNASAISFSSAGLLSAGACVAYQIIEFKTQFAGKDMQDYIAMVMIWYATQAPAESNPELEKEMTDALEKIEQQLDKVK